MRRRRRRDATVGGDRDLLDLAVFNSERSLPHVRSADAASDRGSKRIECWAVCDQHHTEMPVYGRRITAARCRALIASTGVEERHVIVVVMPFAGCPGRLRASAPARSGAKVLRIRSEFLCRTGAIVCGCSTWRQNTAPSPLVDIESTVTPGASRTARARRRRRSDDIPRRSIDHRRWQKNRCRYGRGDCKRCSSRATKPGTSTSTGPGDRSPPHSHATLPTARPGRARPAGCNHIARVNPFDGTPGSGTACEERREQPRRPQLAGAGDDVADVARAGGSATVWRTPRKSSQSAVRRSRYGSAAGPINVRQIDVALTNRVELLPARVVATLSGIHQSSRSSVTPRQADRTTARRGEDRFRESAPLEAARIRDAPDPPNLCTRHSTIDLATLPPKQKAITGSMMASKCCEILAHHPVRGSGQ